MNVTDNGDEPVLVLTVKLAVGNGKAVTVNPFTSNPC